jgi:hypothetical protein
MENIIKQIAGKVFNDGPYEYRIYIKSADLGTVITSISIFIENTPDHVGVDLLIYALGHIIEVGGEELKTIDSEFMINKVIMEEYESLGEMLSSMGITTEFGVQSFEDLNRAVLSNKDKKIDLAEINKRIETRIAKFKKALIYTARLFEHEQGLTTSVTSIEGNPRRSQNGTILPAISANITIRTGNTDWNARETFRKAFMNYLNDHTPIELTQTDAIKIDVIN